jgi:hypothetical protein
MTSHGQTAYDAHHAEMHQQTGRRQSHHKSYENLTPKVRARYDAAGQAVAGPLEAEIADLRLKLGNVWDLAMAWTEISDRWGEPTKEAHAEAEHGRQILDLLGCGDSVADHLDDCPGACCEDARREAEAQANADSETDS